MTVVLPSVVVAMAVIASGCVTVAQPALGKVYSGTYFYNFESSSFTPDGTDENWCLRGDMRQAELPAVGPGGRSGTAHVVLRGTLSAPGHYCNLGGARYVLTVERVLTISHKQATES